MYCKNCGSQLNPNAAFCVNCGVAAGQGNLYCPNCGKSVDPNAAVCLNCGVALNNAAAATAGAPGTTAPKSKVAAGILGILLGAFGVHNFYLGYTGKAVAQLLITLISCGFLAAVSSIWGLVEGIMILTDAENFKKDAKGVPLQ